MNADETFDVAVVGAGAAGLAAALAAARSGARVVLIERSHAPGGVVTNALVHTICGLYHPSLQGDPQHVHAGFPRAFVEALAARGGTSVVGRAHDALYLPIEPSAFTALAAQWCAGQRGLTVLNDCNVVDARLAEQHGETSRLLLRSNETERAVVAGCVIDTSGDATVAALGGAGTLQASSDELQYPSYIFRLDSVDTSALEPMECARISAVIARAAGDGRLPAAAQSVLLRPGVEEGCVYVTINVDKPDKRLFDPLSETLLAQLVGASQLAAEQLLAFLITERRPFTHAKIGHSAARLGVRESRRATGRVVMSADDVRQARQSTDEVCRSSWPIELWTSHRRLRFERVGAACCVPIGALQSDSHPRLAMAGRCMSADHEALGALRVIATSMATGEAAGVNAALAVDGSVALAEVEAWRVRDQIAALAASGWSP